MVSTNLVMRAARRDGIDEPGSHRRRGRRPQLRNNCHRSLGYGQLWVSLSLALAFSPTETAPSAAREDDQQRQCNGGQAVVQRTDSHAVWVVALPPRHGRSIPIAVDDRANSSNG